MKTRIETHIENVSDIIQTETTIIDDYVARTVVATMKTKEQHIRESLIMLGWTPPPGGTQDDL